LSNSKPYSFYKILPDGRIELFVDASLLKDFCHCEAFFELRHMKNLRTKSSSTMKPFPMAIGGWWSDVMERFYNNLRDNKQVSNDDIQTFAVQSWAEARLDLASLHEPDKFASFGDLAGAVLMLHEYYTSQYLIDQRNWKVIGVEEGFGLKKEIRLGETRNCVVYWIGKPDLVVVENGRLTPVDHKTVSRIDGSTIGRYKPSAQMSGYVFACEELAKQLGYPIRVDRCVVNICSRSRPSDNPRNGKKKPRFIRAYPNFSREELDEWRRRVVSTCDRLATCIRTNTWNWNDTACSNFFMRDCDYKKLHSVTPSAREFILAADFMQGEPWRPYSIEKEGDE
jgi:hypothetical protein